ncbi:RNA polymerase sigma factor (sigma-70 family) [Friedmanniella endophytica]|uniref:RNA polymerase sigma factor (Sigma-70 family) n=1 Tax=Microlunatus kandeliicorticis TaxID=1759536 RepID=A0A7W3P499_9ACTN|nr:DUF6596 domain-containing protein [Microlunatus kandeliicorticis]MBA8792615.1 RNA polymerase sigma factor (sigma-70 family) [Microlunatus kandeliicorticis]
MERAGADREVEAVLRAEAPHVLARLARRVGDFASAEDAVQEAMIAAARHWPAEGVPDRPRGWLLRTAERRFVDQVRSEQSRRAREQAVARDRERLAPATDAQDGSDDEDDSLQLLFLCCHPVLSPGSAVALTLRAVGGLGTAAIAAAFLVPENTVATRISRAKQQIRAAGARFVPPDPAEERRRLRSVRQVLYLMFNEGYAATASDQLQRRALADEAVRLTRTVHDRRPADAETAGLLALLLLAHARRDARTTADGTLVPLADQDRRRWDVTMIADGLRLLDAALVEGAVGEYQLQAAIAAEHARAPHADAVDWTRIATLYGLLEQVTRNPVVRLNRAVAVAEADGPEAGLMIMDGAADHDHPGQPDHDRARDGRGDQERGRVHDQLRQTHRWWAVRAQLLERAGRLDEARAHYREAAARATNRVEQRYLVGRAAALGPDDDSEPR